MFIYMEPFSKHVRLAAPNGIPRTAELTSPGNFLEIQYLSLLLPPSVPSSYTHPTESVLIKSPGNSHAVQL